MRRMLSISLMLMGLALLAAQLPCRAQGGFGGGGGGVGGGGQGGGGFGGGRMGPSDSSSGDTFTRQHILTTGEYGEWPLKIEAGETIVARAHSTNFDPYLQVVDSVGKEVAANDDIRDGEQDALVRVTFAKRGDYRVLVKAFKSKGGGQYTFTLHRFTATPVPVSTRVSGPLDRKPYKWYQFAAEKDVMLVLTVRSGATSHDVEMLDPAGERISTQPFTAGAASGTRLHFSAKVKGTHFLRVGARSSSAASVSVFFAPARKLAIKIGETSAPTSLSPDGLDLWTFSALPGDVIRIEAQADSVSLVKSLDFIADSEVPDVGKDQGSAVSSLPVSSKAVHEIALLGRKGSYRVSVLQPNGLAASYRLSILRPVRTADQGVDTSAALPVGDSDYWAVPGKPGQILRLEGVAEQFDMVIDLFSPKGDLVTTNDDGGGGRNPLLTLLMTDAGNYLMRVHSNGDGGGGAYKVKRAIDPVRPLKLGEKSGSSVSTGMNDIWAFTGRAGQAILLSVRSTEFDTSVRLFGPDGREVASDNDSGDDTNSLLSTKLAVAGTYTVWVSPNQGSGKYWVRLLDAE